MAARAVVTDGQDVQCGAMSLTITPLALGEQQWVDLTQTGVGHTAFHCPSLVQSAGRAFGLQTDGWAAWRGGELVGGLMTQRRPGACPEPMHVVAFNGPVLRQSPSNARSSQDRHTAEVLSALFDQVTTSVSAAHIRVHTDIGDIRSLLAAGWSAKPTFTYQWNIGDLGHTWDAMDRNRRRLVRRGQSCGYTVDLVHDLGSDPLGLVATLATLQTRQLERYGTPTPPDQAVWRVLITDLLSGGQGRLMIARAPDGTPVAFQLGVVWGDRAANLFTGSDPVHADQGANSLLRWRAAELLHAEGVKGLDLNGARPGDAGRFKASLGSVITERWDLWRPVEQPQRPLYRRVGGRAKRTVRSVATRVADMVPSR